MANTNCEACTELQQYASEFVQNGVTAEVCASLKNDTGFSPSSGHDDDEDLNNAVDCLIGNMASEIEAYDTCDWKDYMRKFVPNLFNVLKAMLCDIAGLRNDIDEVCELVNAVNTHPVNRYGILNNDAGDQHPERRGGTLAQKSGKTILKARDHSELSEASWKGQNVGLQWGLLRNINCEGACREYEWVYPDFTGYRFNDDVTLAVGDVLWYASKSTVRGWGFTEALWTAYSTSSWTWHDYSVGGSQKGLIWIKLAVNTSLDRLEITYEGILSDNPDVEGRIIGQAPDPARMYSRSC